MSRDEEAQDVSTANEPVLSSVRVDLCRDAYDGHGRLERGDERQRHRQTPHVPVCHQELPRCPLAPARERVVQPDGHGSSQQDGKYNIVHNREVLPLGRVHPDSVGVSGVAGEGRQREGRGTSSPTLISLENRNTDYICRWV